MSDLMQQPAARAGGHAGGVAATEAAHALPRGLSIAFYLPNLEGGGAERTTLTLIQELLRRGARPTLLLGRAEGTLLNEVPAGCAVVAFGTSRTAFDLRPLTRYLRASRPDLLLASIHHNNIVALAARSLVRSGTRLIISLHNAQSIETGPQASLGYRVIPLFYRALARVADGVVAVSNGVADDMAATAGLKRDSISVLHNPVIDDRFTVQAAAAAEHPWLHDKTVPVFVTAGRLTPQKDHATLLQAMALRLRSRPARLIILGEGPERGALEHLAWELGIGAHVALPGFLGNPLPFVREAAAFVLSSRYEGFGNVLVEALGCGTPVISTDCPYGPSEILAGGAHGILTPVGDAPALAEAMSQDLRAHWPAERLRARAGVFSSERVVNGYVDLFGRVLAGQGRAAGPRAAA